VKTTILRPDGTRIEIDGLAAEVSAVVAAVLSKDQPIWVSSSPAATLFCTYCRSWYSGSSIHVCSQYPSIRAGVGG
jgi:hypothetical protein